MLHVVSPSSIIATTLQNQSESVSLCVRMESPDLTIQVETHILPMTKNSAITGKQLRLAL